MKQLIIWRFGFMQTGINRNKNSAIMKKIFIIGSFLFCTIISAQTFCQGLIINKINFEKFSSEANKDYPIFSAAIDEKLKKKYYNAISEFESLINEFPRESRLYTFLELAYHAEFIKYLNKVQQYDLVKKIAESKADWKVQLLWRTTDDFICDNADNTRYTYNVENELWLQDALNVNFAMAYYFTQNSAKGSEYFMENFNKQYFLQDGFKMYLLSKEILKQHKENSEITEVKFAAAIIFLQQPIEEEYKSEEYKNAYRNAFIILRSDTKSSKSNNFEEFQKLSSPSNRAKAYSYVLKNLLKSEFSTTDEKLEILKKYISVLYKTGRSGMRNIELIKFFYNDKKYNNNALTLAILNDNDPKLMTGLADQFMPYFKGYDSFSGSDVIYDVYLYYYKSGEKSKARKAFSYIHKDKKGLYKEL